MEIRISTHEKYHVVWIPKYRKKIFKGEIKAFIEKHLFNIQKYHPDISIESYIQKDHIQLVIIISRRYSVS